MFVTHCIHVYL